MIYKTRKANDQESLDSFFFDTFMFDDVFMLKKPKANLSNEFDMEGMPVLLDDSDDDVDFVDPGVQDVSSAITAIVAMQDALNKK